MEKRTICVVISSPDVQEVEHRVYLREDCFRARHIDLASGASPCNICHVHDNPADENGLCDRCDPSTKSTPEEKLE